MLIRFVKDFFLGLVSYYEAVVFIFQYNLWLYFILPVAFSFGIYFGGDYLLVDLQHVDFHSELTSIDFKSELRSWKFQGVPTDADELKLMLYGVQLIFVIVALKLNKYVVLILMAPVNALLSAKTERLLTGNRYPFDLNVFVSDIYRGVNFAMRNLSRQMLIIAGWYLLTLVLPFLDMFTFFFVFALGSYYYGASLIDYTNERRRLTLEESITMIKKNAGLALGLGSIFSALFFTSFIGVVLAPIPGVIAATLAINKKFGLKRSRHAVKEEGDSAPKKAKKKA